MIDQLRKEYLDWTKQKIDFVKNGDFIEILTPFVDMHHDHISLFLSELNGSLTLSDDGYIVDELDTLGINVTSKGKRNDFFKMTLKIFGISYQPETKELFVKLNNLREYPEKQHRLVQCIIRVSDMLITSRNQVSNFFLEDIEDYFLNKEVFYNETTSYIGQSGNSQSFDFVLPKSKKTIPKLIKAVNNPIRSAYKEPLIAFVDVREVKSDHEFVVLANDTTKKISEEFQQSLNNYNIEVLAWSKRDEWISKLKTS